ncbi:MAG: DsrE family protein [Halobellus sp.]|jgi:peroxiredoxin family protein|uniref:Peroxiredoxin family protein n=1 Tax=Halobellus clavatus TaxID=660517 RepID=A0A1H3DJT4_9EURY|nr:DsrE family protein [Halobellus clavatus]SDX66651.1 Peroxiredoxin family protein [Halobellus clavatus]
MEKIGIIVDSDSPKSLAMAMNLGHTALASEMEVLVYFTFDGLTHLLEGEKDVSEIQALLDEGMPNPYDLLDAFVAEGGEAVTTVACTTTLDMLAWEQDAIDDDVTTKFAGAATFLEAVDDADQVFSF